MVSANYKIISGFDDIEREIGKAALKRNNRGNKKERIEITLVE